MSRTDKDRPFWVQAQDNTLRTRENHNHDRFGRTYGRFRKRGEKTLIEYGDHVWILRYRYETPGMTAEEYAESRGHYWTRGLDYTHGGLRWYFERRTRWEWVGEDIVQMSVPDHCTIDEFDPRYHWGSQNPCWRSLDYSYSPYDACSAEDRAMFYHRPARQASRHAMQRFVDEYNTFGEVDDSTWQDHQSHHAPWGGGWWD